MKYPRGRSKVEGRRSKEDRNSKPEGLIDAGGLSKEPLAWGWGGRAGEEMALREGPPPEGGPICDLEERTAKFGEAIVRFAKKIPPSSVTNRLVDQLVGAGTSVGANYSEAEDAVSRKDFKNRVGTCRKESREAMFFLRMVAAAEDNLAEEARQLWCEAKQLNRIFGSIWRK